MALPSIELAQTYKPIAPKQIFRGYGENTFF